MKKLVMVMAMVLMMVTSFANAERRVCYGYSSDNDVFYTQSENDDGSGFIQFMGELNGERLTLTLYAADLYEAQPDEVEVWFNRSSLGEELDIGESINEIMTYEEFLTFIRTLNLVWTIEGEYYDVTENYWTTVEF